ncbi:MAG: hypothetical protein WBA07_19710 [Rivularia sp. (in: cyanobacteria)]
MSAFLFLLLSNAPDVTDTYSASGSIMGLSEPRLLMISSGLSLTAGISAAFFAWLHPGALSKSFTSIACGFGIYRLVWGFLGSVRFDVVTPYGFTPDSWVWAVNAIAIASAILTIITTALLLWGRVNRLTKILLIIISSVGVFNLCSLSISWSFGTLSDFFGLAFSQNVYLLMWLVTAVSAILAIAAVILLWLHTSQSIKKFVCLVSGFGAVALASYFSLFILLGLGYVD